MKIQVLFGDMKPSQSTNTDVAHKSGSGETRGEPPLDFFNAFPKKTGSLVSSFASNVLINHENCVSVAKSQALYRNSPSLSHTDQQLNYTSKVDRRI